MKPKRKPRHWWLVLNSDGQLVPCNCDVADYGSRKHARAMAAYYNRREQGMPEAGRMKFTAIVVREVLVKRGKAK